MSKVKLLNILLGSVIGVGIGVIGSKKASEKIELDKFKETLEEFEYTFTNTKITPEIADQAACKAYDYINVQLQVLKDKVNIASKLEPEFCNTLAALMSEYEKIAKTINEDENESDESDEIPPTITQGGAVLIGEDSVKGKLPIEKEDFDKRQKHSNLFQAYSVHDKEIIKNFIVKFLNKYGIAISESSIDELVEEIYNNQDGNGNVTYLEKKRREQILDNYRRKQVEDVEKSIKDNQNFSKSKLNEKEDCEVNVKSSKDNEHLKSENSDFTSGENEETETLEEK